MKTDQTGQMFFSERNANIFALSRKFLIYSQGKGKKTFTIFLHDYMAFFHIEMNG